MALKPAEQLNLDTSQEQGFLSFYRTLPEKPPATFRVFDRNDYYTVHGNDAVFAAKEVFKTSGVIKYLGSGDKKVESVVLSKMNFESFVRDLLLVRQYRIEVYCNKSGSKNSNNWVLKHKASPGNLAHFEDLLFSNVDISSNIGVMALKLLFESGQYTVGMCFVDTMACKFSVCEFVDDNNFSSLEALTVQLGPKECLLTGEKSPEMTIIHQILERNNVLITERKKAEFTNKDCVQDLNRLLKAPRDEQMNSAVLPQMDLHNAMAALGSIVKYLELLSNEENYGSFQISTFDFRHVMRLDTTAVRALDILPLAKDNWRNRSILGMLDQCRTPQGQRLLAQWIKQPLSDINKLEERLNVVEAIYDDHELRHLLQEDYLRRFPDFQRVARKFQTKRANLQEVYKVYQAVNKLPNLMNALTSSKSSHSQLLNDLFGQPINELAEDFSKFTEMVETTMDLEKVESNEFLVKVDFDDVLLSLRSKMDEVEQSIRKELGKVARELGLESGKSVKLESNEQLGYYFRVTRKEEKLLRDGKNFRTIDTNKNGVRFNNRNLRDLNEEYMTAKEEYCEKQKAIVLEIITIAAGYAEPMLRLSNCIAMLDVLVSFAVVAANAPIPFVRPKMLPKGTGRMVLNAARHPCLELQESIKFIPNDVEFQKGEKMFHIITGPNMGGKSTYIRSVGVIVFLAHIGSFVPCAEAEISLVDAIMTRIGAGDSQLKGVSTFMTEMLEISSILKTASSDSLIIIDELGRGTSTYDGFGLAWAISDYIATKVQSYTLFATHFHELTTLSDKIQEVNNLHVTALTSDNMLTLLYKVKPGVCDQSFGIHVAEMVHFPDDVIEFAKQKARELDFQSLFSTKLVTADDDPARKKAKTDKLEAEEVVRDFLEKARECVKKNLSPEEFKEAMNSLKTEIKANSNPCLQAILAELE